MPRERAAEKGPERPPAAGPPDSRSLRLSPGARAPLGRSWQTRNASSSSSMTEGVSASFGQDQHLHRKTGGGPAEKGPERPTTHADGRSSELPGIVPDGRLGPELPAGDERLKLPIGDWRISARSAGARVYIDRPKGPERPPATHADGRSSAPRDSSDGHSGSNGCQGTTPSDGYSRARQGAESSTAPRFRGSARSALAKGRRVRSVEPVRIHRAGPAAKSVRLKSSFALRAFARRCLAGSGRNLTCRASPEHPTPFGVL